MSELASSTVGQHSDTHRTQTHVLASDPWGDTCVSTGCTVTCALRDTHVQALSNTWSRHTFPPHTHTHPREPDTHVPSHPAVKRGQKTGTRARRPLSPQPGARAQQPSGSVPSWSLSREAQCVISKQKESSSFPAGRKSRVWGWVGGRVGMCKGAGRVFWGNRHVSTDRAVCAGAWYTRAGGSKVGWGKEPGKQCVFVRVRV